MRAIYIFTVVLVSSILLIGVPACANVSTTKTSSVPTTTTLPAPTATLPPIAIRQVTFLTSDHLLLDGLLLGSGHTVIIFSNQTNTSASDWLPIAKQFAARGYAALVYDYRGTRSSQGTRNLAAGPIDLKAAIVFAQQQGARHIILVGASIGGTITANVAATVPTTAIVILSSPRYWPNLDVTDTMLHAITAPKFFAVGQYDSYASDVQDMYAAANQPKELHVYPVADHGVALFSGSEGSAILQQLLAFCQHYAPAS